jgi:hypothetical protein
VLYRVDFSLLTSSMGLCFTATSASFAARHTRILLMNQHA